MHRSVDPGVFQAETHNEVRVAAVTVRFVHEWTKELLSLNHSLQGHVPAYRWCDYKLVRLVLAKQHQHHHLEASLQPPDHYLNEFETCRDPIEHP